MCPSSRFPCFTANSEAPLVADESVRKRQTLQRGHAPKAQSAVRALTRSRRREPLAVGRKNWLFVGSDDGARANAVFTSLLASCRMVGVEPWAYLRDVLCLIPRWPAHRLLELAPVEWSATSQRSDVRALLDNDPFRNVTEQRA